MKNNFRFIFPRLIGATLVVGLAAFVITTLFQINVRRCAYWRCCSLDKTSSRQKPDDAGTHS